MWVGFFFSSGIDRHHPALTSLTPAIHPSRFRWYITRGRPKRRIIRMNCINEFIGSRQKKKGAYRWKGHPHLCYRALRQILKKPLNGKRYQTIKTFFKTSGGQWKINFGHQKHDSFTKVIDISKNYTCCKMLLTAADFELRVFSYIHSWRHFFLFKKI